MRFHETARRSPSKNYEVGRLGINGVHFTVCNAALLTQTERSCSRDDSGRLGDCGNAIFITDARSGVLTCSCYNLIQTPSCVGVAWKICETSCI